MFVTYLIIRLVTLPFAFLPYRAIHWIGRVLGTLAYHFYAKYRKRALSNLAHAKELNLSNQQIIQLAKQSIQSLMITCLEYPKLSREKKISNIAFCENPQKADELMKQGKGVIFFCGHQANWELLFLEGTSRMPGVAIGRPIKNQYLYNWILKIRQKFGGKIIQPQNAFKEGLKGLKKGAFLGIVGDQGMPNSGFFSSFLGREAWTSPLPAMLAYKTQTPIIIASTIREKGKYRIHYSEPIFPNSHASKKEEISRLMKETLKVFQETIKTHPEQWLWVHNRWKQQTLDKIKKPFRQDSIAFFLPNNPTLLKKFTRIRKLYPTENLFIFFPENLSPPPSLKGIASPYSDVQHALKEDFRFKLIVNFTNNPSIEKHYKKYSASLAIHLHTFEEFETLVRNA